ncbi:unnamed protein product [Moneuplotes crassus]|uniref:Uncharacterized protein n=1 Tax=Euplotes crassus TaxID=5936 RepID=A0AAD1UQT9_EUPCR|nr:unnamed protein product [Moneuplotes crassus]
MDRAEAFGTSKVVVDKIKARERQKHLNEIRCAKSLLDNSVPGSMRLRKGNPKKERMLEERYTEIERANRILLEKMANIIGTKNPVHHNLRQQPTKLSSSFFMPGLNVKPSLNSDKRKRELNRINFENNKLLRRLQSKKPTYDIVRWAKDRRKNEKIIQNISAYPHIIGKRNQSVPKKRLIKIKHSANTTHEPHGKMVFPGAKRMKSIGDDSGEDLITNQSNNDALNRTNMTGVSKPPLSINTSSDMHKVRPFPTQANSVSSQRILLFEKKQRIGKNDYLVEISRDKLHLFIIAFLIENPKYFTLQLPMKQAFKLLLDLDNSFEALIDLLYFKHGSLVLPDIFRPQFSPRNMGIAAKTTNNKDFPKYKGFGSNMNSKGTISEATASRPALENTEFVKPLGSTTQKEKPVGMNSDQKSSNPHEEEKDENDDYKHDFKS